MSLMVRAIAQRGENKCQSSIARAIYATVALQRIIRVSGILPDGVGRMKKIKKKKSLLPPFFTRGTSATREWRHVKMG